MSHLKKMHKAIQMEIDEKLIKKAKQLQTLKQHQKILNDTGRLVVTKGTEWLYKKGMTEKQLRAFISNDRELKMKKFKMRQIIKDVEKELNQLEFKKKSYETEFERKKTQIQIEEHEHKEQHQFRFDGQISFNPKMRRSVNRKRALLHDTLHTKLQGNHMVTAFETKHGEQYTVDLLRKTEEHNLEEQRKYLEEQLRKEAERKERERLKRLAIRKRIASAKAKLAGPKLRKNRCLSAVMKQQEAEQYKNSKKPYLPPEMMVGINSVSQSTQLWSKTSLSQSQSHKFIA